MQTTRQSVALPSRLQPAQHSAEPKRPAPATAPQPVDAELLKFVGGAGLAAAPVNRWATR